MDDNMPPGHDEHTIAPNTLSKESGGKAGPVIGIVVIILVLLLGVLYFWGQRVDRTVSGTDTPEIMPTITQEQNTPEKLESDFTRFEQEIDQEFMNMENELSTEF